MGFIPLLSWIAFISLQLGVLNLFPIPVFDGGQIFVLVIEGIIPPRPRPQSPPDLDADRVRHLHRSVRLPHPERHRQAPAARLEEPDAVLRCHGRGPISVGNPGEAAAEDRSRSASVGVLIGGGAPVSVQSMTKTDTRDVRATVAQIRRAGKGRLRNRPAGGARREAADASERSRSGAAVPLIADIHFDHRLALACLELGVDGLRLNPEHRLPGEGPRGRPRGQRTGDSHPDRRQFRVARKGPPEKARRSDGRRPWSKAPCATSGSWRTWISA